jgi:hypothetical protein
MKKHVKNRNTFYQSIQNIHASNEIKLQTNKVSTLVIEKTIIFQLTYNYLLNLMFLINYKSINLFMTKN